MYLKRKNRGGGENRTNTLWQLAEAVSKIKTLGGRQEETSRPQAKREKKEKRVRRGLP